jgi:hypothetical protein
MAVYNPRGAGNVHIDRVLTNISIGFPNAGYVGDQLFPVVDVQKQSDKYHVFGRETWGPAHQDLRAPGTVANEIPGLAVSLDSYFAGEHALQIAVHDEERENADAPLDPDREGTELVTSRILLGRELAIKTLATTAANYATNHSVTLSGTAQWNDYANSNPIGDIRTAVRQVHAAVQLRLNTAIMPYQVMSQLEDHPDFIERIKYSERGVLTEEIIGSIFGIPKIIVPEVGQNTAALGLAPVLGYLWGKDVILAYVPPRPGRKQVAYGYEFNWGLNRSTPQVVDRWRETPRVSDVVRVRRRYDIKFVTLDGTSKQIAGYLIKTAVA